MIEDNKIPLYKKRPEPRFEVTVDEHGESVSTPIPQSPFPIELVVEMRKNHVIMNQVSGFRFDELKAHKAYMLKAGPELERKHGVSAREIFLKGNSKEASRLHAASLIDYQWVREYASYL